ncbi:MAG: DUF2807 domain-containing protein [Planctomycetes bacterium]|nr:DUF2807 domain-containing protein [Planctomycetota bacterium]
MGSNFLMIAKWLMLSSYICSSIVLLCSGLFLVIRSSAEIIPSKLNKMLIRLSIFMIVLNTILIISYNAFGFDKAMMGKETGRIYAEETNFNLYEKSRKMHENYIRKQRQLFDPEGTYTTETITLKRFTHIEMDKFLSASFNFVFEGSKKGGDNVYSATVYTKKLKSDTENSYVEKVDLIQEGTTLFIKQKLSGSPYNNTIINGVPVPPSRQVWIIISGNEIRGINLPQQSPSLYNLQIKIYAEGLDSFNISSATIRNVIDLYSIVPKLDLTISGGSLKAYVSADSYNLNNNGDGYVTLNGYSETFVLSSEGKINITGRNMTAIKAQLNLSVETEVELAVEHAISAVVTDLSKLTYHGNPKIKSLKTFGSGVIKHE